MKNNKLTVTIGIPAYNAEKNIKHMLKALSNQLGGSIIIDEIIVRSDKSIDETVKKAKEVKNPRIKIIDSKYRIGFANSLKKILDFAKGSIVVVLNDDIKIEDPFFIEKLVKPFFIEQNVAMVSGNPKPIKGETFVEKAIITSFRVYEKMRYFDGTGINNFTCDGKVLAFSREFIKSLKMPKNKGLMGNVDGFLYFYCITNGFLYRHARKAIAYWKCPSTVSDYIKWTTRNNSDFFILESYFGQIVKKEYHKPTLLYLYYSIIESLKNPIGSIFLILIKFIIFNKTRAALTDLNSKWETIQTTKTI